MNSETQYLVKLMLIDSSVRELLKNDYIPEAHPTLMWMRGEIEDVQLALVQAAGSNTKMRSWLRVGDAVLENIYSLKSELPAGDHKQELGSDLFLASVMTHILDDMYRAKNKRHLIEPLLDAAYSLELMVEYKCADDYRSSANDFINAVYGKMEA